MFKYKGHDKINDDRTAKSEERQINKIHPHRSASDAKSLAQPGTDSKRTVLEPTDNPFKHNVKVPKKVSGLKFEVSSFWFCVATNQKSAIENQK